MTRQEWRDWWHIYGKLTICVYLWVAFAEFAGAFHARYI